ncbi:beta-ketoacyl-[acyl-carrier-protein] synthase family protein [Geoalkalibacter halelectricus]|uniref:Beta-ketoacyl-[acyl-carrier-protein] synthase family protein n=1 Tax=Geoalkalibacter halelectricus TaxID=2847045 RepID=A0ABY5ZNC5_9BACT|nr:beta-ketoacyl-[acyl-carrier-protein] synthase family protein [Geoalkalibacter halelectricus]MDO3379828.1 beta-ketoacyl-[acyl-carrier-protein] synthase family protein [Geoalkalibacter halelectricus]UWZ80640.1 beta-ketoacyl-[acyl-carrier-protein] synthase family protein [Geoalkalibacter halelectricus]
MKRRQPVAITGAGCLCAAGPDLAACMEALFRGQRKPAPPELFSAGHAVKYPVFEVPESFFPASMPADPDMLRTARLARAASAEALADAGWEAADLERLKVGVIVGTTVGSAMNNEAFYREYRDGGSPGMEPIGRFLAANPAAAVADYFGFRGPVQTIVNACSSGTDAVGIAAQWIRAGLCDLVLAGGADELCRTTYNGFISLMITDSEPVRPFDLKRKGLNLGEGAGMLVLESDALIQRRPDRVRAWLAGYGGACDAYHLTAPHPEGSGLKHALSEALDAAGCQPEDIAFINAHGTGTPDNDRVESRTLADVFPGIPFLSTKGFTGHTLGAAGGVEAALTLVCLEQERIPANIGFSEPDPDLPACPVAVETIVAGRFALSQSLAFGGNNAVIVMAKGERR